VGDQVHEPVQLYVPWKKNQRLEVVISSGWEPLFADERAIRETLLIVMQKIDDDIGKLRG
jgi:hypothetical protein